MNTNPYLPPGAALEDPSEGQWAPYATSFFAVSVWKMCVMSFATFGTYGLYWFYKNWQLVREREHSDILPFWRAFFGIFFCYPLLVRIRDHGKSAGVSGSLPAGLLASGWIILEILSRVSSFVYGMVAYIAAHLLLVFVQYYATRINKKAFPGHYPNSRFSGWNWFGIAVFIVFVCVEVLEFVLLSMK
jgi:hypothetical protein